jgi:hypothetical protein
MPITSSSVEHDLPVLLSSTPVASTRFPQEISLPHLGTLGHTRTTASGKNARDISFCFSFLSSPFLSFPFVLFSLSFSSWRQQSLHPPLEGRTVVEMDQSDVRGEKRGWRIRTSPFRVGGGAERDGLGTTVRPPVGVPLAVGSGGRAAEFRRATQGTGAPGQDRDGGLQAVYGGITYWIGSKRCWNSQASPRPTLRCVGISPVGRVETHVSDSWYSLTSHENRELLESKPLLKKRSPQ